MTRRTQCKCGMTIDPEIRAHYELGVELDRLARGASRIEFVRTKELLRRFLPPAPARVLDVGGGPGVYAEWLADDGYEVRLVDAVSLHVEDAGARAAGRFTAVQGVALAAISRFASLLDGLLQGHLRDAVGRAMVERDLATGVHRSPPDRPALFTTAYFHRPEELHTEVEEAGLTLDGVFGVEGPGWLLGDRLKDELVRDDVLTVARAVEQEPTVIGASGHLLAIAHR